MNQNIEDIKKLKISLVVITLFFGFLIALLMTTAPTNFSLGRTITIEKGQTVRNAGKTLEENKIIKSKSFFGAIISLFGKHVIEGDYFFPESLNLFSVIKRITSGSYAVPVKKITFFEGITVEQMADILKENFPNFDAVGFTDLANDKEGYLFPDTYNFSANISPEEIVEILTLKFESKIEEFADIIGNSKYSLEDIVTMASIIEKEATRETIQDVGDVLWKRIEMGMALQVDAPFIYAVDKNTFELTHEDLKEDHPYNTYTNKGLTPTPISNPGIESILAAAQPQETPYLYFLTGSDGEMYFAENFEQHKQNKVLYLK